MSIKILINDFDLLEKFGIVLDTGGLEVFQVPPTPREPFYNEWPDQSGRDYDGTAPLVYETQFFEVPFLMVAKSQTDYIANKSQLLSLVAVNAEIVVKIPDYSLAFKLRYKGVSSWQELESSLNGQRSARMVLKFENNHNPVTDEPVETIQILGDSSGSIIVVDNKVLRIRI